MSIIRHSQRKVSTRNVEKARITPILSKIPFASLFIAGNVSGNVTGTFSVGEETSLKIYGCGGGGNGSNLNDLSGARAGAGAASQVDGYVLTVTPGETLNYSVGTSQQPTIITRSGSIIFYLSAGTPTSAGANNAYSSHAGGAGGAGGSRYNPGGAGTSLIGCAGGGGGGGFGDSSPVQAGASGGPGGTSSVPPNSILAGTAGGGGGAVGVRGSNVLLARGGISGGQPYFGGGGGAGAGLTVPSFPEASGLYFGGGAGGNGPYSPGTENKGGPGFLVITAAIIS